MTPVNYNDLSDDDLRAVVKDATQVLHQRLRTRSSLVDMRIQEGGKFEDSELVYAATARCLCGAGLCYPSNVSTHGAWRCSGVLTHRCKHDVGQHDVFPFVFYEIKSEQQPSAKGATTRPATT